jgi:hypothetical protein
MEFALHFVIFAWDLSIASPAYVYGASSVVSSFFRLSIHSSRFLPPIAAERVTSIKSTYPWRLNAMPFVPATTYRRATLGANSAPNTLARRSIQRPVREGCGGPHSNQHSVLSADPKCPGASAPYRQPYDRFCWCAYWDIYERMKVFHNPYNRIGELRLSTNRQRLRWGADLTTCTACTRSYTSLQVN